MGRGQRGLAISSVTSRKRLVAQTCDQLSQIDLAGVEARALRKERLSRLAELTIDNYQPGWNDKLLPFINQLGLSGSSVEQALGQAPERWPGGYRGCALNLAQENLAWAVDRDGDKLDSGERDQSRLTNSWVSENISIGWRDTYLSALLDRINDNPALGSGEEEMAWSTLCAGWRRWSKDHKQGGNLSAAQALSSAS